MQNKFKERAVQINWIGQVAMILRNPLNLNRLDQAIKISQEVTRIVMVFWNLQFRNNH